MRRSAVILRGSPGSSRTGAIFFVLFTVLFMMALQARLPAVEEPKLFRISDLSGALQLSLQLTREKESSLDYLFRDIRRDYLEGGIRINTVGSIYHSNFLTFMVDLNLVGHRSKNTLFSDASVNNSLNNTYNIRLSVLKKKALNLQLYAMRNFATADRAFFERYFTTFKSTGLQLLSRAKFLPFELDIYTNRMKSESPAYKERDEKTTDIDLRVTVLSKPRTRSFLTIRRKQYAESVYGVEYRTLEAMANLGFNYGVKDMNMVTSNLSFNRMRGRYDMDVWFFRSNLIHYIKPYLNVNAAYHVNGDSSEDRSFTKHEGTAILNYRLFQSVNTTAMLGVRLENSVHQRTSALQHMGSIEYKKKFPTGGIRFLYAYRGEKSNFRSREDINEFSEVYRFPITGVIIITRSGLIGESIRVTSADFSRVYLQDVDYQVDMVASSITITRLPGGAIPDESSAAIYFRYLAYPDFVLNGGFTQFQARINFLKYLHLFYVKSAKNQDITSEYTIPPFEEFGKKEMGARFISRLLSASYTYEDYDSTLAGYKSHSFNLSGQIRLFKRLNLSANMRKNRMNYENRDYFSQFDAYSGECSLLLGKSVKVDALYRQLRYETRAYLRDRKSILLKLQWDFRKIILNIFYEYILTGTDITERGRNFLNITIRRTF